MGGFLRRSVMLTGLSVILLGLPTAAAGQPADEGGATPGVPVARSAAPIGAFTNMVIGGVKALAAGNAWAVGSYCASGCGGGAELDHMLIVHWNGTAWSKVTGPAQSAGTSYQLTAVAVASGADVWATGYWYKPNQGTVGPVILHWDGTSWSSVAVPNPGVHGGTLWGVTATSATSAWAVGDSFTSAGQKTLILHWDGTAWSRIASPSPGPAGSGPSLLGVSADSATDAWATGVYTNTSAQKQATLALHWNGTAWSKVATPSPGGTLNELNAVTALSATSAWAAGEYCLGSACRGLPPSDTLIMHWNGKSWARVASPNPGSVNHLAGLTAVSATNAWAAGSSYKSGSLNSRTLILQWNGKSWTKAASPNPSASTNDLTSVSADSATDAWAMGTYCVSACNTSTVVSKLLALHWDGSTWSAK
jgi:hypothetical protein